MILYKENSHNIIWGIWKIEEDVSTLLSSLSDLSFADEISSEKRLHEQTAVRVLLKKLAGEEKRICYNDNGKPYLADGSYHISISHTRGFAAVILSGSDLVGIDIEYVSDKVKRVRSKFVSDREYIDPTDERNHLLLHWCAKETMYKAVDGSGLDFKKHLLVEKFTPQNRGVFKAYEKFSGNVSEFEIHYLVTPDYVLTYTY